MRGRLRAADDLRRLLRHEGRARLRGRAPRPRRAARARLGRHARGPRRAAALDVRRGPARARRAVRGRRVPGHHERPDRRAARRSSAPGDAPDPRALRRRAAAGRHAGRRSPARTSSPCCCKGDTNPALRAEVPAALGAWRRGDAGPLARLIAHAGGRVTLGQPDTGVAPALYAATVCEELSLPLEPRRGPPGTRAAGRGDRRATCRPRTSRRSTATPRCGSELLALCLRLADGVADAGGRSGRCPRCRRSCSAAAPTCAPRPRTRARRRRACRCAPQVVTVPVGRALRAEQRDRRARRARRSALAAFFADAPIPGCTDARRAPISLAPRPPMRLAGQRGPSGRCAAASAGPSARRSTP